MRAQPEFTRCRIPAPTRKETLVLLTLATDNVHKSNEIVVALNNQCTGNDVNAALRKMARVGWIAIDHRKRQDDQRYWYNHYTVTPLGEAVAGWLLDCDGAADAEGFLCGNCAKGIDATTTRCPRCSSDLVAVHARSDCAYQIQPPPSKRNGQARKFRKAKPAAKTATKQTRIPITEMASAAEYIDEIGYHVLRVLVRSREGLTAADIAKQTPWRDNAVRIRAEKLMSFGLVRDRTMKTRRYGSRKSARRFFYANRPQADVVYDALVKRYDAGTLPAARRIPGKDQMPLPAPKQVAEPVVVQPAMVAQPAKPVSGLTIVYQDGSRADYPGAVVARRTHHRTFIKKADSRVSEIPNTNYRELEVW